MTGIVVSGDGKRGFWFVETDQTHQSVFVHQKNVKDRRFLRIDDRVRLDIVPSAFKPGQMEGANVEYIGHTIARQVGGVRG